jgi:rhodanese-related sulfurtransferase
MILSGIFMFFGKSTSKNNVNVLGDTSSFTSLTLDQFSKILNSGNYTLIDVRTLDEYNAGHLKNARQIDYYQKQQFSEYLESLNKEGKYLIYCRSGRRSGDTLKLMKNKGFTSVYDMVGGYNAWLARGLPTEK